MLAAHSALLSTFARRVARDPSAPIVASPTRRVTAGDVADRAERWSTRWPALEPGSIVGLRAPGGSEFLSAFIALHRLGAVPALLDPSLPDEECRRTLAGLGAQAWVACSGLWPRPGVEPAWESVEDEPDHRALPTALPTALATPHGVIKLTSGSTGTPRGIEVPAEALLADAENLWSTMGLEGARLLLSTVPLSHSYGLSSLAMPALLRDTTLVVADSPGPLGALQAGRTLGAEFLPTVPAWLAAWSRLAEPPPLPDTLRLLISAGAPLAPETAARVRDRFGRPVQVFYGSSESGGITFDREGGAAERGTVGTPIDGVRVTIDGEDGRVVVHSPAVARGYLPESDPDLSAGRFRSGDFGRFEANGELRLLGRADDLVLLKGQNVSPREVEEVLRSLPGVDEAAVLGIPFGPQDDPILRAALGGQGALLLSHQEIVDHCRRRLAEHKIPRSILVFESLPRTERGKVNRDLLRLELPPGASRPL